MPAHTELVSDLKALRKGRGLFVNNVDERVGSTLRDLCGVTEEHGPGEIRDRVAQLLARLAGDLPEDLRMAVMAAFGIIPEARQPLYQDRVGWIAERLNRDPRTARRRIDDGIQQLAQLACTPLRARRRARHATEPGSGWHTSVARVTLTLDRGAPEALEYHRIVAARDGLTEIELGVSLANVAHRDGARQPRAEVSVVFGGTLVNRAARPGARPAFALALPTPLAAGETHEFALQSRIHEWHAMPRQFVYVPRRRCDSFELRVRFDRCRPPRSISRLSELSNGGGPAVPGESPTVDRAGEIHLTFQDLSHGLGYGARWDF